MLHKLLSCSLVLATLLIINPLFGCVDDGNTNITKDNLIGNWKLVQVKITDSVRSVEKTPQEMNFSETISFEPNSKFNNCKMKNGKSKTMNGTWKNECSTLKIYIDEGQYDVMNCKITADNLLISKNEVIDGELASVDYVYERI
jgi:hypothetical protein